MQKLNNKMKTLENPTIEILYFNEEDVISTSGILNVEEVGEGDQYDWGAIIRLD